MPYDLQKYRELKEARQRSEQEKAKKNINKFSTGKNKGLSKNTIGNAKNLIKNLAPTNFLSLVFQMRPFSDWMYGLAFMAAIMKDLLDLTGVTGILYPAVVIATFCCSIFIGFMMLLGSFNSDSGGRVQRKIIRSWLVLLGGTTAELLLGINFLPIETFTVLIIYGLALMERKQAQNAEQGNSETQVESDTADDYGYEKAA